MTRAVAQYWLLFAGPTDTGLAVQLEPVLSKKGVSLAYTPGPIGERLDVELKTGANDNTLLIDAYRDLENSARNGGSCGYALLQSEDYLRCEATFRFQFEKKYLNGDVLQNVSGASADLLFGLAVVTAVRNDLDYPPFAATGILSEDGQVQPIDGLSAKIHAALDIPALRGKGLIFYPKANDKDIDAELRHQVEQAQITLKPVERLEEAVECLGIPIQGTWLGNPYRRLDIFEYSHRRIYFGRENEADHLADKLFERAKLDRPSLLILGPSGGGKSSLVQAGLIPELGKRFKDQNLSLLYSIFDLESTTNKDIHAIAASIRSSWSLLPGLAALAVNSSQELQIAMTPSDVFAALVSDLITYLPDQTSFVWVLDQLEQFFTLGLREEADAAFIHLLRELQARGIWIVATFRNDFYSTLRAHDGISSIFDKAGIHDLENLSETTIERIIQNPAKLAKLEFEKDDQKSELLSLKLKNDAIEGGKDILPLLEFALDQLYEKRELKDGRTQLTWAAYETMGGLHGAIGKRADDVLNGLDQAAQATLGRVLRALVKLRRDAVETESGESPFIASVANVENFPLGTPRHCLVNAFVDARLFVGGCDNEGIAQVRVTHEALFTHWSKASEILRDSIEDIELCDRLADRVAHWKDNHEEPSLLLPPGPALTEAQELLARMNEELDTEIAHYIERSNIADQEQKEEELKKQRRRTLIASVTAVVLGILLIVAMGAIYFANQNRNQLTEMLTSSYFNEGARLVDEGRSKEALAYLTQAMRLDSRPDTTASRLAASLLLSSNNGINISSIRIQCHENRMSIATFSPDGQWVIAVCGFFTVQIWDAISGEPLFNQMKHKNSVRLAKFSPNGRWVATASANTVQIWEATTGTLVSPPMEHSDEVRSTQFSPDGRWVVTVAGESARVWNAATGEPVSKLMKHEYPIRSAQFSSDGRWVVTASGDTAQVWDAITGTSLSQPIYHKKSFLPDKPLSFSPPYNKPRKIGGIEIYSAQFSPDRHWVITAAQDSVRVWEATTGELVSRLGWANSWTSSANSSLSPDGRWVVTVSGDMAQVWIAATGEPLSQQMRHENLINSAEFSPDGRRIVTVSQKTVRVWDAATGQPVMSPLQHESTFKSAKFSPDGRRLLTSSWDNAIRLWETGVMKPLVVSMDFGHSLRSAYYNPDRHWVVTVAGESARVWDAATGEPVSKLIKHENPIWSAQFSSDGRWVVTTSGNMAQVWEADTGEPVFQPMRHWEHVSSARLSPDGRWVITVLGDMAQVWIAATGEPLSQPMRHEGFINLTEFSPDGQWIVTASIDKTARVWDVVTGEPISKPMQHKDEVRTAQFSPDGQWIVTVTSNDKTARVWDVVTGEPISKPMQHKDEVRTAQFSPDGQWIVTASIDKTARVWEAVTGNPASVPLEHQDHVSSAQFSLSGSHILTMSNYAMTWGGNQYTVSTWEIPKLPKNGKMFIEFLELISGDAVNNNALQQKYTDPTISELRNWAATTTDITLEERTFINWLLSDPIDRTITPNSKQTVKERVQILIERDTIASLDEAIDYYPGHPMALAKLAAATWRKGKPDQQGDIRPRVALWANLALKYAPDDAAVRAVADKVLQDIAQPN